VGDQLTLGERAADRMRNGMGSWGFVFAAMGFLALWMLANRGHGFDPYPFILLNLVLSCLAAMQGAILLIAAKRADQISSELAAHDYQTNVEADEIVKLIHALTAEIHAAVCGNAVAQRQVPTMGSVTSSEVPDRAGLAISNVPPNASTRSRSPMRPDP
jgi:uncharacterized membrane protein